MVSFNVFFGACGVGLVLFAIDAGTNRHKMNEPYIHMPMPLIARIAGIIALVIMIMYIVPAAGGVSKMIQL